MLFLSFNPHPIEKQATAVDRARGRQGQVTQDLPSRVAQHSNAW